MYCNVNADICVEAFHSCNPMESIPLSTLNRKYGNCRSGSGDFEVLSIRSCVGSQLVEMSTQSFIIFANSFVFVTIPKPSRGIKRGHPFNLPSLDSGPFKPLVLKSTLFCLPVPILTTQKRLTVGQIRRASSSARSDGLLLRIPPSMNQPPGGGFLTNIGLKKDGAALVQRAASQMAQLSALNPLHPYDRNITAGPSALVPLVATTKVGQGICVSDKGMWCIGISGSPNFSLMIFLITVSRRVASKRARSPRVGMTPTIARSMLNTSLLNSK